MMVVQIEKPGNMTLANWFSELRSWFDQNYCQPTLFNQYEGVTDKIVFNITVSDENQARVFSSEFCKICTLNFTHPNIERANLRKTLEPAIATEDSLALTLSDGLREAVIASVTH